MERLFLVGLNHKTAAVAIREQFALGDQGVAGLSELPQPLEELFLLSTCNRVELLGVGPDPACETALEIWSGLCGRCRQELEPHVYILRQAEAVRHVFSVAASLDSMILGEPQILGQMKDAYRRCAEAGTVGALLNRLLHKAFSTAKRVRSETGIAAHAVSVSYAAVELARRIFDDMTACRAMLIGAGDMAELAATHLLQAGVSRMTVVNRTPARAQELAGRFGGLAATLDELGDLLVQTDIVISSTGAREPVITAEHLHAVLPRRRNKPMFFIDIAVPRDVDPRINGLDNVYVYDIDDLKETVEENLIQRRQEAAKAAVIIEEECRAFMDWHDSLQLQPTIVDLIRQHEHYAEEELARALKRFGNKLDEETVAAMRSMLGSLVRKINHAPISFLKAGHAGGQNTETIAAVRRLFALDK